MHPNRLLPVVLAASMLFASPLAAAEEPAAPGLPTIATKTKGLERREGFLGHWLDRERGKIWLELPAPQGPRGESLSFLYVEGITTGLGSNPIGLDRGQLGEARLVVARRVGARVLFEVPNLKFRALTADPAEAHAVAESFAPSVLWGAEIAAAEPDGRLLVDLTGFLVRDAHGIVGQMQRVGQGDYSLDTNRSAVDFTGCLSFPDNLELEAVLTYSSSRPGPLVRATAPLGEAPSFVQHHSFVRLPDPGYRPRAFDPRAGSFSVNFADYAAPLSAPIEKRWIVRHRLEKVDPTAARSKVVEPIVYYVDPGAPEPVRSALLEGARFWAPAFAAAGFEDAYRVELLPPGAHPLDVRYNVIQWVHRSTRGWSYGGGVIDPRTGEMIKGHVSLGSLRIRQDRLIFEGLVGAGETGRGGPNDPLAAALARIRQLSAHEVGHTLGFAHNYAASTYNRGSVMDYPAPLVGLTEDGGLDLSNAYAVGPGVWDMHAVRYAYQQFPPGADEAAELEKMVRDGLARGLVFLTDQDARPPGAANAAASLWDNGSDPVAELAHVAEVRRRALARFGLGNLGADRPQALLEEVLAPIYFYHRYQVEAAVKQVGGIDYRYAFPGDGQPRAVPVGAEQQWRAIDGLVALLDPATLDLPDELIAELVPRPPEYDPTPEAFPSRTAPVFDPLAAAGAAAGLVVDGLLQPERAARMVDLHRRDPILPSFDDLLHALLGRTFPAAPAGRPRLAELHRTVQTVVVEGLIALARNPDASPAVRAQAEAALGGLAKTLAKAVTDGSERAHRGWLAREIGRFLARPAATGPDLPAAPEPPPGSPIGTDPAWASRDWLGEGCRLAPAGPGH
jgi:hypothetical protein